MIAADFRHLHRKRQRVIRIFKQAVITDLHRMKKDSRRIGRQTKRPLVTDEMHLMPAARQFFAQPSRQEIPLPPTEG